MLLYWGIFTAGFIVGAILSYMLFAAKKPQDDPDYDDQLLKGDISGRFYKANPNSKDTILTNPL